MTLAVLMAACAGIAAAAGLTDLAVDRAGRPRAPRRPTVVRALALLRALGHRAGTPAPPKDLRDRIEAAGLRLSPSDVMAIKAGAALAGVLGAAALTPGLPGRLGPFLLLASPLAGFIAPDLHLRRRAARRAEAIEDELADVLDLLRVALTAGLGTTRALSEVGRRHPGVLARELHRTADETALGTPRATAYANLARRSPTPRLQPLVAALTQAERRGVPPSDTLAALAAEARADQVRAVAERAARAAPQIQLVVALLLVPSVLLLVAAALIPAIA